MSKNNSWIWILSGIGALVLLNNNNASANSQHSASTTWVLPLDSNITQAFGSSHNGIDLHASPGTVIVSPADGVVKNVYYADEGGNQLIIAHDNGYGTGYAHLTQSLVNIGDRVSQGQQIALSGNTGTATTGAHLHFVLTDRSGTAINPVGVIYSPSV